MAQKLNNSTGMPQMKTVLTGWFSNITLGVVTQGEDDYGKVTETIKNFSFKGVLQPLQPEELELKPEGLRNFEWLQIHSFAGDLNLTNDDKITYNTVRYKVMGIKNYALNGYIEYHIIQDYQNG